MRKSQRTIENIFEKQNTIKQVLVLEKKGVLKVTYHP